MRLIAALFLITISGISSAQTPKKSKPKLPVISKKAGKTVVTPKSSVMQGLTVSKINITNIKKIDPDAIRSKLKTKVGEPLQEENLRADVQNVFDMGHFFNVEIIQEKSSGGVDLEYRVTEKPAISEIKYVGNDKISKDDLEEASGIKPYTILNHGKLKEAIDKLTKLYEDKGFFLARIKSKLEEVKPGEEVRLIFEIKENDKVMVKKVTFLGNRALTDSKLKSVMNTQEGGPFSWLTSTGSYKQEFFDRDLTNLTYTYFNEGYVQVKIDRPQVYVTPDKKSIYITIRIEEGEQFNVGKVDFGGDLLFSKEELFQVTEIHKSKVFVYETLQKDLRALQFKYGDLGYAFANIIPKTNIREKERLVDITFEIEKGQKVYFGEINVTGNSKTRDKVVRRELAIKEGELYNETNKRKSEESVRRLGYFSEVIFNTSTPPDQPTILNLEIQVKEKSTGTIQVGAGYSTVGGFLFNGQINQSNLFGKGQVLGFSVNINDKTSTYNLSFTEPYFLDSLWSVGFDLYRTDRDMSFYREVKYGGDIRFGHPIAEYWTTYLTYKLDNTQLEMNAYADPVLYNPDTVKGITSSVTGSIAFDRRNNRLTPTAGEYGSASVEQAGLGGNKIFTKSGLNFRFYKEIFWNLVFRNNLNYGFITAPAGRDVPFNELYLLGGAYSLRGYDWYSIGKKRLRTCCQKRNGDIDPTPVALSNPTLFPYGGTQQAYYQAEIEFNIVSEAQIKGVLFYDAGTADDTIQLSQTRQDVGFGFRWFSPIGPLRFEWGFPLERQAGEKYSNFEFSIGSPF